MISVTNKSKIVNGVQHKQCSGCKRFKPDEGIVKHTFFEHIINWWNRRKEKKKDPLDKYMTELPKT